VPACLVLHARPRALKKFHGDAMFAPLRAVLRVGARATARVVDLVTV
jgi:hypothetical protein